MDADSVNRPPFLIAFASHDGHAAAIARHMAARLEGGAECVDVATLDAAEAVAAACRGRTAVGLVAAVRYGKHLKPAEAFLERFKDLDRAPPLALATVNLTARKPNKQTLETNPYLKKLVTRHRLTPAAVGVFAGRLDYPRYRWFDRQMIRFIMWVTGGPTDGTSTIEYTDWSRVEAFADDIAALATARTV